MTLYNLTPNRVRVLLFMKRNPALTFDEFAEYWRDVHGPKFMSMGVVKRNILRYEQMLVDHEWKKNLQAMVPPGQLAAMPDYDGVVLYEAESLEKLSELSSDKEYQENVSPDSAKLFDLASARFNFLHVAPIIETKRSSKGNGVRLVCHLKKKAGLTLEEFSKHWLEKHSHVVASYPKSKGSINFYEQGHIIREGVPSEIKRHDSTIKQADDWDGVPFLDADSFEELFGILSEPEFLRVRGEDELKFVDMERSTGVPVFVSTFIG